MNMKRLRKLSQRLDDVSTSEKAMHSITIVDIESSAKYFLGDEEITEERWLALVQKRNEPTQFIIELEGEDF